MKLTKKYYLGFAVALFVIAIVLSIYLSMNSENSRTPNTQSTTGSLETMAWIYPGEPSCNALNEIKDGRKIDIVKPEFFTVTNGSLQLISETGHCNEYSQEFLNELKQYSKEQYVTVSGNDAGNIAHFLHTSLTGSDSISTLVNFVLENDITGVEIDFENFGDWEEELYTDYLSFVTVLGNELQQHGKKLQIDAPAIWNEESQSWFIWRYEDFANLPVDKVVVMAYDYHFDYGAGSPVAPLAWIEEVISYTLERLPLEKVSVGLPSYGYKGITGELENEIITYEQATNEPGFETAERDEASSEMTWQSGANTYFYNDSVSMDMKRQLLADMGITSISVWHLGGNQWFSN